MNTRVLFVRMLMAFLAAAILLGCQYQADDGASAVGSERVVSQSSLSWAEWAQWVEEQHSVGDDQGHEPDIGSDEWA